MMIMMMIMMMLYCNYDDLMIPSIEKARSQGEKEAAKYMKSTQAPSTATAEAAGSSSKKASTPNSSSGSSNKGSSGNIAVK